MRVLSFWTLVCGEYMIDGTLHRRLRWECHGTLIYLFENVILYNLCTLSCGLRAEFSMSRTLKNANMCDFCT